MPAKSYTKKIEDAVRLWGVDTVAVFDPQTAQDNLPGPVTDEIKFHTPDGTSRFPTILIDSLDGTVTITTEVSDTRWVQGPSFRKADIPAIAMTLSQILQQYPARPAEAPPAPGPR